MIIICEILTFKPGTQQLFSDITCRGVPLERRDFTSLQGDQSGIRIFNTHKLLFNQPGNTPPHVSHPQI